jgi:hypothetical protein
VTRYRVFGDRHVHRRPGEPAVTHPGVPVARTRAAGTWPTPAPASDPSARHRAATASSLRNGLTAAAVVGGTLALVPAVAMTARPDDAPTPTAEPDARLRLAAGDTPPTAVAQPVVLRTVGLPGAERLDALPPGLEVSRLVKAAGLAEAAERAERRASRETPARCDADLDGLGRMKAWARAGARFLSCLYDEPAVAGRSGQSDRPDGLAVEFIVRGQRADRLAACALANQRELGVSYVLWRQRANHGDGWERVSDGDEDTANPEDHLHISFQRSAPDGTPQPRRCR